ncbi:ABC-2 type transport system ATP-binding protein [Kitasatospora sp. GAS204A]|nr:ABC transporter ATP-binding protein [Kitasatospora sp. GAS204B]MDH6119756.1 ABC-2 type transport system ATP-binding protein [Kitasatospora sp. GAS204B]
MKPVATTTDPAVEFRNVSKRYGAVQALDQVSLTVGRGEFFAVLGPNGAGKTTLVEIAEGLRQPDSGTVTVLGQRSWPRNTALLRRLGVQSQASSFFTRLTAGEHLETVAALYGLDRAAAQLALELVGLSHKARSRVDTLSGGQRQRLAVAGALVHGPSLVFLDEPTAALDPQARHELWGLLLTLRRKGLTIICTTHHMDEAELLCDRVAILEHGRLIAMDSPANLIRSMGAPTQLFVPARLLSLEQARALEGIDKADFQDGEVMIETRQISKVFLALAATLDLALVRTRNPTLEDAYLHLTATERQP